MNREQVKTVCDMDCFNCKYDDCVNDVIEIEEYVESENLDRDIISRRSQKKARKMSEKAIERKREYLSENAEGRRAYAQAYYALNRERYVKYRLENRERKSAYDRRYFSDNRDKISQKHKIYGLKNKEHLRERQKEWREKNREKIREYQKEYYNRKKLQKATSSK